ncbi:hypothetical protein LguiB_016616 [Lonicera macranthoides]
MFVPKYVLLASAKALYTPILKNGVLSLNAIFNLLQQEPKELWRGISISLN